jgi:threonine dehydrogenase-like Zn-dependent dehydrogenase
VYTGPGQLTIRDIPRPVPGRGQVVVQIHACSICGTDRKIYRQGHRKIRPGEERVLGHEIAGEIVAVGDGVGYYRPGMRVAIAPNVGCGSCPVCQQDLEQLCPDYDAFGISWPGGFAEYVLIPEPAVARGNLVEIPAALPYDEAAVVEPLACCLAGREAMGIEPGDSLLVFGAGPMGNLHLLLNKHLGVGRTIVVDVDEARLEFSRSLGADFTLLNDATVRDRVMEITAGNGVDAVIVAASVPALVGQALDLAAISGVVNLFAGLPAGKETVGVNVNTIHYRQVRVVGTTGATRGQFRRTLRVVCDSGLSLKKIITLRIGLGELGAVLGDVATLDRNMKIVVEPSRR